MVSSATAELQRVRNTYAQSPNSHRGGAIKRATPPPTNVRPTTTTKMRGTRGLLNRIGTRGAVQAAYGLLKTIMPSPIRRRTIPHAFTPTKWLSSRIVQRARGHRYSARIGEQMNSARDPGDTDDEERCPCPGPVGVDLHSELRLQRNRCASESPIEKNAENPNRDQRCSDETHDESMSP